MSESKEPLNKNNKVPKLRFNHFKADWFEYCLSDFATRITERNKKNRPLIPLTISAQDGLINQYDYFDKQIASLNLSTYYIIRKGEFAYNKSYSNGYPYGAIKRLDRYEEGALSSLYICFKTKLFNSDFLVTYFDSNKWNKEVKLISGEGARNHGLLNLSPLDFFNIKVMLPNSSDEQEKISKLFNLVNAKIDCLGRQLKTLKKYKEGLNQKALKMVILFGEYKSFNNLFQNKNVRNCIGLPQYTVGKYGIKTIEVGNYNISNHKIFNAGDLIVGIGVEEIGISTDINGSVSPVYDVYKIIDERYYDSIRYTFKNQIWKQRNFITRKSTRREFEVDKKSLQSMKIKVVDNRSFKNYSLSMHNVQKMEKCLLTKLHNLLNVKKYLLNSMFI